jgi:hypothetical protein
MSNPCINFYNMVLSNAKLLDSTRSKQQGRRTETNHAQTNRNTNGGNNTGSGTNHTTTSKVKWTAKNMFMKKSMSFSKEDWA